LILTIGFSASVLVLRTCIRDVSTPEKLPSDDGL
jgi:hypothetical protein